MINKDNRIKKSRLSPAADEDAGRRKIEELCSIIEREAEKSDSEADVDLIDGSLDRIDALTSDHIRPSAHDLALNLKRLRQRADSRRERKTVGRRGAGRIKAASVIAAVIIFSFITLTAAAYATGHDNAIELILRSVGRLFGAESGVVYDDGKTTIIKNSNVRKYSGIEEFFDHEELDIIYPSYLPEGVNIAQVLIFNTVGEDFSIIFSCSDKRIFVSVENRYKTRFEQVSEWYNVYSYNDMTFYIIKTGESEYQAILQHEGFEYTLLSPDYDELIKIINGLREPQK